MADIISGADALDQVTDGDSYCIIPSNSSKVFDIQNGSTADGAALQQYDYYGNANQKFKFQRADNGYCYIISINSNKVLDVTGGPPATANGIKIQQWANTGGTNQQFLLEYIGNDCYRITARNSGKVLDVSGGPSGVANGIRIQQWDYNGGTNQQFKIQRSTSVPIVTPMPLKNLGMVGIKNNLSGRYLQAHSDNGEMHASNPSRNTEETWFVIEVDKNNKIYALQNWQNGKFMSKKGGVCAPADSTGIGIPEQWVFVKGAPFGLVDGIAMKSVVDGQYLGSNSPGDNSVCGGEVSASDTNPPLNDTGHCAQWWIFEPATTPTQGHSLWSAIGDAVNGVIGYIAPIALNALISAL